MISLKTERELKLMRDAGRIVAEAHREVAKAIAPGVSTRELDVLVEDLIVKRGARPAFKGYMGYPASICTSCNDEVVHGIPGLKQLGNGDIISVDIGVELSGYYGDAATTYPVGDISPLASRLIQVTEEALDRGIAMCQAGRRLTDISHAIERHVEEAGFSVVRDYVGHGIGTKMHEDPQVPNFGPPGRGPKLRPGLVLAIEPMVNAGGCDVQTLLDNWTVVTSDGSLSAHAEHTVAITDKGPVVLTEL